MRKLWLLSATALTTLALGAPVLAAVTDEIVVRARKRDESLQDVPVSATVISSEDLDNLVLDAFEDYIRQVPGAIFISSGPDYLADIGIRGQGGGRLGFSESATGIYRNGIYVAGGGFGGRTFNRLDTFDLARVETYRGPQGALYGRNAVGGAINIISQRPKFEDEARAKVGLGTYNAVDVEAIVNAPLIADKLAIRVGGFFQQQDGFHKRLEDGTDIDPRTYYGARLGALAKPWEDGQFVLTLEHYDSAAPAFGTTSRNPNKDPGSFMHSLINRVPPADILENSGILEYEQDLGWADLTVLGAYKFRRGARLREDLDHFQATGNPTTDTTATQSEHYERWGTEVRLASPVSDGRWNWLVGADWQMSDEQVSARNEILSTGMTAASVAFEEGLDSYSAFGLLGYDLTDRLNLTLEARILHDEKRFEWANFCPSMMCGAPPLTGVETTEWTRVTPGATLTFEISPDHTVYGRFATGYRPGGFNQNNVTLGGTTLFDYGPEYAFSYEAGWKASYFDRKLQVNASVYYSYTNDVQTPIPTDAASGINSPSLLNSGDTDIYGGELEIRGQTEFLWGDLLGTLGLGTVQGEYRDGSTAPVSVPLVGLIDAELGGARVEETRDYILSVNLTYTQPLFNTDWKTSFTASLQAEGGGHEDFNGDVAGLAGSTGREKENFEVMDFRWSLFDETWRASVFAKNAFNETVRLRTFSGNDYFSLPQTFGAELSVRW